MYFQNIPHGVGVHSGSILGLPQVNFARFEFDPFSSSGNFYDNQIYDGQQCILVELFQNNDLRTLSALPLYWPP